jgi:hypothetical protein
VQLQPTLVARVTNEAGSHLKQNCSKISILKKEAEDF